jgi:ferric-dicitrate binding protein FerR (iron transport regulator)
MSHQIQNILQKGKPDSATETERQEMLALFHRSEMEFLLKEQLLEEIEITREEEDISSDLQKVFNRLLVRIEKNKLKQKSNSRLLYTVSKIAAAVVIGLFIGIYVSHLKFGQAPEYYIAHSPKGSISEMILPDGSVIFLNADSRIKYSIDGKNKIREVFLQGEAWFDVMTNKKKPFVVHTPFYDVNVTGTQFNIKAYISDSEVTTTLEKGQVTIHSTDDFKIAEDIILKPGEQLVFNNESKKMTIKSVNTKWFSSWKENKLIFVNMSMKELVILLNRKYGVDIEVKNSEILDLHFDGTIKNESIIEILEILKKTLPIDYKIAGQKIEITNNKN